MTSRQLRVDDAVTPVQGAAVTRDFFRAAGVTPLLGRFLLDADYGSATGVVVLGHDLWSKEFESSPAVIGRSIDLDGRGAVVVGVAPVGFSIPNGAQVWTPKVDP